MPNLDSFMRSTMDSTFGIIASALGAIGVGLLLDFEMSIASGQKQDHEQ